MSLSFIQWEKYIQGFPDDRLGQEFQDPGSTVAGPEKPPQAIIITEMGNRNAARKADEAVRASQGQPTGTIAEQTYGEFAGEGRPIGGPGGGPFPGGLPMGPGGPPPGDPPMGPGGPPMGGPPMGGPPMMAYGGSVPGYQYGGSVPGYQDGGDTEGGGFLRGIGSFLTGAGSWEEAADKPLRTLGHSALSAASFIPGLGMAGWGVRALGAAAKGRRLQQLAEAAGRGTVALRNQGGTRQALARLLDPIQARSKTPGWMGGRSGSWITDPKTGERIWDAGAGMQSGFAQIGRRSIKRGGGALGVAGLLALDPFDGPEPTPEGTAPLPNTNLTNSSAIRSDRAKGFAGGGYDWLGGETKSGQDLRQLVDYRNEGIASGDLPETFQDRASRAFLDRLDRMDQRLAGYVAPAQGYATPPQMDSGDTTRLGYHKGGGIPHEHDEGGRPHAPGYKSELRWSGDLATPPGTYWEGKRSVLGDINRSFNRAGAEVRGLGQDFGEMGKNILEAILPGQQFGEDQRNAQGRFLRRGRWTGWNNDRESFDPDQRGRSGNQEWVLVPKSDEELAAESPGGPPQVSPGGPPMGDPPMMDGGFGVPTNPGEGAGMARRDQIREAMEQEEWLRTQNPEEVARDDYWESRRRREQDNSFSLLAADVASAISGSGGIPGNIGKGLADATRNQIEHGRRIMDLEELPITANVERSRRSTFDDRMEIMDSVATNLESRGGIDAEVAGRIEEIRMQVAQRRELSPESLMFMQKTLEDAVTHGTMTQNDMNAYMTGLTGKYLASQGFAAR